MATSEGSQCPPTTAYKVKKSKECLILPGEVRAKKPSLTLSAYVGGPKSRFKELTQPTERSLSNDAIHILSTS
ncbi:hypothetical protein J6590_054612 [Homalodisca vitripennis]|nr:hypothetical protein J6590_054612 [Homalodisca vitripennis]